MVTVLGGSLFGGCSLVYIYIYIKFERNDKSLLKNNTILVIETRENSEGLY